MSMTSEPYLFYFIKFYTSLNYVHIYNHYYKSLSEIISSELYIYFHANANIFKILL
jgi:hypothetical protein